MKPKNLALKNLLLRCTICKQPSEHVYVHYQKDNTEIYLCDNCYGKYEAANYSEFWEDYQDKINESNI